MNKRITIIAACGVFVASVMAFGALPAFAAETPSCTLDQYMKGLDKAQHTPAQDYLQGVKNELVARKQLLAAIYSCGTNEAHALQATLQSVPLKDAAIERTRQKIEVALDDVFRFYETQQGGIAQLGIGGTQDAAQNLKTWRASNFEPLAQETARIALWEKQEEILATAENRFAQIKTTLQRLKLSDDEDIMPSLTAAGDHLQAATDAHSAAKEIIAEGVFSDQSLPLLKQSLDSLSATYQNFFDISQAVNKILPH